MACGKRFRNFWKKDYNKLSEERGSAAPSNQRNSFASVKVLEDNINMKSRICFTVLAPKNFPFAGSWLGSAVEAVSFLVRPYFNNCETFCESEI